MSAPAQQPRHKVRFSEVDHFWAIRTMRIIKIKIATAQSLQLQQYGVGKVESFGQDSVR